MVLDRASGRGVEPTTIGMLAYVIVTALVSAMGVALVWGGLLLIAAGGSPYYLVSGAVLLTVAIGLVRHRGWALAIHSSFVVATLLWAIWESGMDFWALLPRIALFWGIGLVLVLPVMRRRFVGSRPIGRLTMCAVVASLSLPPACLIASILVGAPYGRDPAGLANIGPMSITTPGAEADWPAYGGTSHGGRFSELSDITPKNVAGLKVAWTYELKDPLGDGLEVTPLKVGDSLYACNASNVVVSLDPATGREKWRFDPQINGEGLIVRVCRGIAYYRIAGANGDCAERIYTNTIDARLIAIDARTGRRCASFGRNGEVSLVENMGEVPKGYYLPTSAPTVARGRLIVNGAILDNQYVGEPSGVVRAFDAVTGKLSWAYDVGQPDRIGAPPPGQHYTRMTPNSWTPLTYDDALGLVYVPTGSPTPDYYGGFRRPFDEEIGNSLLALDVETGRRRWLFQAVHHDLWDYDLASPAVLFDLPGGQRTVHALALPTKRGETFLLDRVTGRPIDPVVERRVSTTGGIPGERISPSQPFPTGMPSLAGGRLTERMMWGLTPFDQLWCRIAFRKARYEGQMTPPGLTPSIMYPGYLGGMDWGGVAVDNRRGIMIAVTNQVANYVRMITRAEADAAGAKAFGRGAAADLKTAQGIATQEGTPYAVITATFLSPIDVPCQQPPWAKITAVDLRTKRVLWSRPLGTGKDNGPLGIASRLPFTMGVPSIGASLVTASGLTFVGASTDRTFRAFDTSSGKLLWRAAIPASANSGAMSYRATDGRQFVVVAAGGHHILRAPTGQMIIAYALPPGPPPPSAERRSLTFSGRATGELVSR